MRDASTIIARLRVTGNEWVAFFPDTPGHAYYSDEPVKAVRRLLEGTDAESGVVILLCDGHEGNGTLRYQVTWDAPSGEASGPSGRDNDVVPPNVAAGRFVMLHLCIVRVRPFGLLAG